jgi:hypothetical protein
MVSSVMCLAVIGSVCGVMCIIGCSRVSSVMCVSVIW